MKDVLLESHTRFLLSLKTSRSDLAKCFGLDYYSVSSICFCAILQLSAPHSVSSAR